MDIQRMDEWMKEVLSPSSGIRLSISHISKIIKTAFKNSKLLSTPRKPHRINIHSNYALAKMSVAKSPLCRLLLVLGSLVLLFLPTHAQSWQAVDLGLGWGKPVSVDALLLVDTLTDCI
jgi:hypothetical protein